MSIQPRTAETVSARIGHVIGIDSEHFAHVYYPAIDTVKVYDVGTDYEVGDYIDEETCEHTEELNGRPLAQWMCYVREFRGEWIDTTHRAPAFGGPNEAYHDSRAVAQRTHGRHPDADPLPVV